MYIDPENLSAIITKKNMVNPDLTLIILDEQEIPCHPDTIHHKLKVNKVSAEVR